MRSCPQPSQIRGIQVQNPVGGPRAVDIPARLLELTAAGRLAVHQGVSASRPRRWTA
jgi:hypothetical protein